MATPRTAIVTATPITPSKMMTATVPTTTMSLKKAGPPVPPRPAHATTNNGAVGLLKTQRHGIESVMNTRTTTMGTANATSSSTASASSSATAIVNGRETTHIQHHQQQQQHPIIQKKPTHVASSHNSIAAAVGVGVGVGAGTGASSAAGASSGRTVIYKSPSMSATKRPEAAATVTKSTVNAATSTTRSGTSTGTGTGTAIAGTKPPLKLRKAPDIPTMKPKTPTTPPQNRTVAGIMEQQNSNGGVVKVVPANGSGDGIAKTTPPPPPSRPAAVTNAVSATDVSSPTPSPSASSSSVSARGSDNANGNGNIVIVQNGQSSAVGSGGVNLSRHHSMGSGGTPKTQTPSNNLKDTRLSLGRVDFERVGKIQLDQLPTSAQPLPRPRKIVKVPVATLDLDDNTTSNTTTSTSSSSSVNIFRRSKTTLDHFTSRANNITTISTGAGATNSTSFLGGKTAELKNNLKNAAERLFSEIIVSQQRQHANETPMITKHEQHQSLLAQELIKQRNVTGSGVGGGCSSVTVVTTNGATLSSNCTRININGSDTSPGVAKGLVHGRIESLLKSPEKKTAFHEILISELAAMRGRSGSMDNLTCDETSKMHKSVSTPTNSPMSEPISKLTKANKNEIPKSASTTTTTTTVTPNMNNSTNTVLINNSYKKTHQRCNSLDDHDPDTEDVDADNVEDTEDGDGDADGDGDVDGDDDIMQKANRKNKLNGAPIPRKRCPSGCSSDSSPYGTERSARIRTSDWIEVGDNGKEVTMTSCHISLEDSGLEDEERLDEMSSLGVGDSWDSVKDAENVKRCRNVKR